MGVILEDLSSNDSLFFENTVLTKRNLLSHGFEEREPGEKMSRVFFSGKDFLVSCVPDADGFITRIDCWISDAADGKVKKRMHFSATDEITKKNLDDVIQLCGAKMSDSLTGKYHEYEILDTSGWEMPEWKPLANLKPSPWDDPIRPRTLGPNSHEIEPPVILGPGPYRPEPLETNPATEETLNQLRQLIDDKAGE